MEIYYKNNEMGKIYFDRDPYWMAAKTDLFDHEWQTESGSNGKNRVVQNRKLSNKTMTVVVRGESREDCLAKKSELVDKIDVDVEKGMPGRLYAGEWYLNCWLIAVKAGGDYIRSKVMAFSVTVMAELMDWIHESTMQFLAGASEGTGAKNLDYVYDFPFDYASGLKGQQLENGTVSECDFRMTIYGPCANPEILIGGHKYAVSAALEDGEYLTIDSTAKKIYKTKPNGDTVNQYYLQDREYYIFRKIQPGRNSVSWNGLFGFDITLYEKRSEPRWI